MKCQESKQLIHIYLDGELSKNEERILYSHMAVCVDCQLDMDRARDLHDLLERAIQHVEPPQDFAQKVMANLPSRTDTEAKTQALAELASFKEENATEETVKENIEDIKENKKIFEFNKRWIGIAAGVIFAFFAVAGAYQVFEIANQNRPLPEGNDPMVVQGNGENQQEDNIPFLGVDDEAGNNDLTGQGNEGSQQTGDPEGQNLPDGTDNQQQNNQNENAMALAPGNNRVDNEVAQDNGNAIENNENHGPGSVNNQEPTQATVPDGEADNYFVMSEPFRIVTNPTSIVTFTHLLENVLGATWCSNGNSLLYLTQGNGNVRVFESQISGENRRHVRNYNNAGIWSPNKNYIAYTQNVNGVSTIWVEGRNGGRNLTPERANARNAGSGWAYNPVWSSRNEIAFLTDRFGGTDIMVVDMAGNSRRITFSEDRKDNLTWSPDGTQIAYFRSWEYRGSKVGEIAVVSASGDEDSKSITPTVRATNMVATWSPDGRLLAVNVTGEQQGVWVTGITNEGDWDRRLANTGGGRVIEWSPDGQKIAFSDSQGVFHILIWRSAQANVEMIQITPMGSQMANASIEWSRASDRILLKQPTAGNNKKSVWIATLPSGMRAY